MGKAWCFFSSEVYLVCSAAQMFFLSIFQEKKNRKMTYFSEFFHLMFFFSWLSVTRTPKGLEKTAQLRTCLQLKFCPENIFVYHLISTLGLRWIDNTFSSPRGKLSWSKLRKFFHAIHSASQHIENMLREKERNTAMICRKDIAVSQDDMWLIVSLTTVISASSLLVIW